MSLFALSQIVFRFLRDSEFAAPEIRAEQGKIAFSLRKTIHKDTPFLSVVKPEGCGSFYAGQRVQHRRVHLRKAVLIQASAFFQADIFLGFIFGESVIIIPGF